MSKKETKLTEEELNKLQSLQNEYNQLKLQLGDTVMQQSILMKKIDEIRTAFSNEEKPLMDKYGENSTIDLQTGVVTQKPKEEEADLKIAK
tara:strand:- start:14717 stop:14989 length:273 start_codon:yes stop_codon:yes gene_type:complete